MVTRDGFRWLTLNNMFMIKISLLCERKASKPYESVEKIPMSTPNICTPWKKAQSGAADPTCIV